MSQPQDTALINDQWFANAKAQINAVADNIQANGPCAQIQSLVNSLMADLQAAVTAVKEQISKLAQLLVAPTDLGSVIAWIKNFQQQYIQPYTKYLQQLEQWASELSSLISTIIAAAGRCLNCSINIPSIDMTPPA
jgi:hypothetical protein